MTTKEMSSKSVCPTRSEGLHVFATLYLDYGLVFGGATLECRPTSSSFVISTSCHPHRRNFEFRCLARGCSSRHHHSLEPFVVLHRHCSTCHMHTTERMAKDCSAVE